LCPPRRPPFPSTTLFRSSDRALPALRALLTDTAPSAFWQTHLRLDRACKPSRAHIGRSHADGVLVNAVLPVLLLHAEQAADTPLDRKSTRLNSSHVKISY